MRLIACLAILLLGSPALACGPDTDCRIGERIYRIALPQAQDAPVGAILYLHGYRGSARGAMGNTSLRALAEDLGVALIAAKSYDDDWRIPGVPRNTDADGSLEFSYFDAVMEDVAARHGLDPDRVLVTGFSAGGMMVWNLACHRGTLFKGFAPIAGTFWEPIPAECPSAPVDLIHTHGTSDKIVPLHGRTIADTKQGGIDAALALFVRSGGFGPEEPVEAEGLTCTRRTNPDGRLLEFCTHPGGHTFQTAYIARAWEVLMTDGDR